MTKFNYDPRSGTEFAHSHNPPPPLSRIFAMGYMVKFFEFFSVGLNGEILSIDRF